MKLSEWAKKPGISYKPAWRWVRQGKMPVPVEQTSTGMILVKEPEATTHTVALYARVSSTDQKADLDPQIASLVTYASHQGGKCSCCGQVLGSLPLGVRKWACPACGTQHDRDVNAAKNLLALALAG